MAKNSKFRLLGVSFLSFCFLAAPAFSCWYDLTEVDAFSPQLNFENPDLSSLAFIDKLQLNSALLQTSPDAILNDFSISVVGLQLRIFPFTFQLSPLRC